MNDNTNKSGGSTRLLSSYPPGRAGGDDAPNKPTGIRITIQGINVSIEVSDEKDFQGINKADLYFLLLENKLPTIVTDEYSGDGKKDSYKQVER